MITNLKWRILIFSTTVFFTIACLTQVLTGNVYANTNVQEILITEVVPMSQSSNDAYEYIELYNNSDRNIDLKDYKLPLQNIDITTSKVISPKGILVVCTKGSTTLGEFNTFYGTTLALDKYMTLPFVDEVLSNNLTTSILLAKDDATVVVRAQYNATDFEAKKGVTYKYTETGFDMLKLGQSQSPTPGSVSAQQVPQSGIKVTSITLDKTSITMDVNQTAVIHATISPDTATNKAIVWTSSNPSIVEVSQKGILTSKAEGVAYVSATTVDGGLVAFCTVVVRKILVTGITLDKTSSTIEIGKSIILKASLSPANATNKSVNWESNNSNIASVDSTGKVVGKAAGTAMITVTTVDGNFKGICVITVKDNKNTNNETFSIRLNKTSIQIKEGKFEQLTPIITPGNLKKTGLIWKSSNDKVAYVTQDGRVFGKKAGYAVITVTKDGVKATCNVQIISGKEKGKGKGHSK
ncbi:Ig-like domain-containing protein [Clostridium estertheticum]|uniref:Ig-like domain-containing protein n=1 Tax=Clostridium estertheticum TaxID=238834 RepID=UPI0013E8F72C|nr:Ig-like domain-containing protein [Clostridium estertheticum]MBZ9686177.1 Ig-like domain-containing protein [Clostridium estertheticum]